MATAEMLPVLLTFATARRSCSSDLPNTLCRGNRNRVLARATKCSGVALALALIVPELTTEALAVLPAIANCPTP